MPRLPSVVAAVALASLWPSAAAWASGSSAPRAHLSVGPARLSYLGGQVALAWSAGDARSCTLSASPRFFTLRKPRPVKCNGRLIRRLSRTSRARNWTFTFKARGSRGQVTVVKRGLVLRAPPFLVSANWAGYIVQSSSAITEISGRFTVPVLDCRRLTNSGESAWVGIGGIGGSSGDLLQTGVRSNCDRGTQDFNTGWWAEFPAYREIDFDNHFISAGDSIEASVSRNTDGSWTTRLDDLTSGISGVMTTGGVYGTVSDSSPTVWLDQEGSGAPVYTGGYSAEWIVEDFEQLGGLVTLADFGTVAFTDLTASLPTWSLTGDEQVGIGDYQGHLWAVPSQPDATGRGFSVSYTG